MTRGLAHPPELRAQVIAAVLAGASISALARQYGLSKGTISGWLESDDIRTVRTDQRARDPDSIYEWILDLVAAHVTTIQAQLQAASSPAWLEKQSAAELAQLVAVERDTAIRLLGGLEHNWTPDPPALGPPGPPAATDG